MSCARAAERRRDRRDGFFFLFSEFMMMPSCVLMLASLYTPSGAKIRKGWGEYFGGEWRGRGGRGENAGDVGFPVRYPAGDSGKGRNGAHESFAGGE